MPNALTSGLLIAGLAASLVLLAAANLDPATTRAQQDLEATFRQYHDTLNAGDVPGAVAFFTDDGVFEAAGRTFAGTQALQSQFQLQVNQERRVTVVSAQVSGDTLTASVEVRSKQITSCDSERVIGTETATFNGDKITRLVFQDDAADPQTAKVLTCTQAGGLPATGGEPLATRTGQLSLALLMGAALLLAGGLVTALGLKRRG